MSLYDIFLNNQDKICHKWLHYFPVYEKYLSKFVDQDCTLLEIGVQNGGSLGMWKKYLGHRCKIIGIDITDGCKNHASDKLDIHIRIGDQQDLKFLNSIVEEFGTFDIIIDDGGHKMKQISTSFNILYPHLNKNGIYIAEDLHTCYWPEYGGAKDNPETFINISKNIIDELNSTYIRNAVTNTTFSKDTFGIYFHDSMVVLEKGRPGPKTHLKTGK